MTTDTDSNPGANEIALPRFEELLRRRLVQAHHDHAPAPAAGGSARRPGLQPTLSLPSSPTPGPSSRRRARRSLTVGAGMLAAAAAIVVTIVARQPDGPGAGGHRASAGAVNAPPPPELSTRIIAAIDGAQATSVVHVSQDNARYGDSEGWVDETSGAMRLLMRDVSGAPSYDISESDGVTRQVDYCFSEYAEGPPNYDPVPASGATGWVQKSLDDGRLVEDGTQVVDGRELLRLREVPPDLSDLHFKLVPDGAELVPPNADGPQSTTEEPESNAEDPEPNVALVDPETYLPVKYIMPGTLVQTYEYLPRASENLAQLTAPVPQGFTQVPSIRSDGERADASCSL